MALKKERNVPILVNNVLHCSSPVLWGVSQNLEKETGRKQLLTVVRYCHNSKNKGETNPSFPYSIFNRLTDVQEVTVSKIWPPET